MYVFYRALNNTCTQLILGSYYYFLQKKNKVVFNKFLKVGLNSLNLAYCLRYAI